MTERHALGNAISIGRIYDGGFAEAAQALGVFGLRQMATACVGTHDFAGGGNLKPLGRGFLCFDAFGTSHKI